MKPPVVPHGLPDSPKLAPRRISGRFRSTGERDADRQPLAVERHWTVRVDIDGTEPCHCLSVTGHFPGGVTADLLFAAEPLGGKDGRIDFAGALIFARDPDGLVGATHMRLSAPDTQPVAAKSGYVLTLADGNATTDTILLERVDGFFRDLAVEIDDLLSPPSPFAAATVLAHDPLAHPNHPADLEPATLTVGNLFGRAGLKTKVTAPGKAVADPAIGDDALWDESELHAAMVNNWNANPGAAGWRIWQGHVSTSVFGKDYMGLMFDVHDELQRQGSAIFLLSYINSSLLSEFGKPDLQELSSTRRVFFTMLHEMGHCLNLAHSFEKDLGTQWMPLAMEPEARSFMNYAYKVAGGEPAFFADFRYLFSPAERLFLRHAPEAFVVPGGNANDGDHGAVARRGTADPRLTLTLAGGGGRESGNRRDSRAFLEPVWLDLTDPSAGTAAAPDLGDLIVRVRLNGGRWRRWQPMFHLCAAERPHDEAPAPPAPRRWRIPLSLSRGGWLTDRPGRYEVDVRVAHGRRWRTAPLLGFTVLPPATRAEQRMATAWMTPDVARILAMGGCPAMPHQEALLEQMLRDLPGHPAALHAALALAAPYVRQFKSVVRPRAGSPATIAPLVPDAAQRARLDAALRLLSRHGVARSAIAAALSGPATQSVAARLSQLLD